MTFIKTWNEALPAGTRDVNLGAGDITDFKYAIRERLAIDHDFRADETGITTIGYHKAIHMIDQVADPAGNGVFYRKGDDLYYTDGSGNTIQLTSGGVVNSPAFPSGISCLWDGSIATIPAGWTINAAALGKCIRGIATDTTEPGTSGGSDTHVHTGPSHTHTIGGSHNHWVPTAAGGASGLASDSQAPGTTTNADGTGNTGSASSLPAYYSMAIIKKT